MRKVTIIIATYNRAHFILEMLLSIQNQSYKYFECIIIDDGGNDNTKEVISPILKDERFQFLKRPSEYIKGLCGARNFGLDIAKGDYIFFCDDDDVVHPRLLEITVSNFQKNTSIDFVHYKKQSFENNFEYLKFENKLTLKSCNLEGQIFEDVITGKLAIASCTVLWKKEVFDKYRFNESLNYAEEWELYSKIFVEQELRGVNLNDILYFNRKHPESNTGEFWRNNPKRVASKKIALQEIVFTVLKNNKLTNLLFKYFVREAHVNKQSNLINYIFEYKRTLKMVLYHLFFPLRFKTYKLLKKFK